MLKPVEKHLKSGSHSRDARKPNRHLTGNQEFLTLGPQPNAIKLAQVIDMPGEAVKRRSL